MKALTTILFSILLLLSAVVVSAQQRVVPVTIEHAEIDSTDIDDFEGCGCTNQLDIERNQDFTLKLELFGWQDSKDVEIRAFISGYEFNDVNAINDQIGPFDFFENVTYVKKMKLTLPDDVNVDKYLLRVVISDRNGWAQAYNYALSVDTKRHDVKIKDVTLSPGNSVKASQALLARIRVENKGQKEERDIKVSASLPALGVSAAGYVDKVKSDDEKESEELFLKLPKCADPGVYDLNVDVWYNDGHNKVSQSTKVTVLENEQCKPEPQPTVIVQQAVNQTEAPASDASAGKVRNALEIILLVLVALLVIVGLILGFTRMRGEE